MGHLPHPWGGWLAGGDPETQRSHIDMNAHVASESPILSLCGTDPPLFPPVSKAFVLQHSIILMKLKFKSVFI